MLEKAKKIVAKYIINNSYIYESEYQIFVVWQCKTLQNWKFLMSTSLGDGMYYEVTYNGDKKEFYLDAYKKVENKCIKAEDFEWKN